MRDCLYKLQKLALGIDEYVTCFVSSLSMDWLIVPQCFWNSGKKKQSAAQSEK